VIFGRDILRANFSEPRTGEVRRIVLLRAWVNREVGC
jgi:hypothetical protein